MADTTASARPTREDMSLAGRGTALLRALQAIRFSDSAGRSIDPEAATATALDMVVAAGRTGAVYVIGNGGSSSVAAHAVNDLVNVGRLRAHTLHDAALFSCMANDYGYDNAFARILDTMARPEDLLVAISSSGQSANIRNAVTAAAGRGAACVTLSGFRPNNPLRTMGSLNVWVDAADYGLVEMAHMFVLHTLADRLRTAG